MKEKKRRMKAEWEPQRCVQLTWPHAQTDWASMLPEISAVYQAMAHQISLREPLLIVGPTAPQPPVPNATFAALDTNDTWARDHGFITVEEDGQLVLLDFQFNGWGQKFRADLDNALNRQLYDLGLLTGRYEPHLDFVLEGGSLESDGRGTVFTTACCLLAPHRNQPLDRQDIESRLKLWLGAERIVWLEHGSLLGDDTDGHIDTLVRICPDDTIVYTGADSDHPDLLLMERELQSLRTLDGRPYRLLRVPLPRPVCDDGDRLPATYANYLVLNGAVLVPTYAQPDLDHEAMATIRQAYPDRQVVGIDCRAVVRQHGSLHCCTMQYY